MRAKRDRKEGWIPLCKADVTAVSTREVRRRVSEEGRQCELLYI